MNPHSALHGTCAFRMMPTDSLEQAPSTACAVRLGEQGLALSYTWSHPNDGEQHGSVLLGGDGEHGLVEASWFDTWHQQPTLMRLQGSRRDSRVEVMGTYEQEWGWSISVDLAADTATMTMCNVVPESALAQLPADSPPMSAGPYEVMVATWRRDG